MKNKCLDCGKECSGKRCKECFIKSIGKKFIIGEWTFNTQKDLDTVIKDKIRISPRNMEFDDEFLLKLINELHHGVIKYKLKCTKLKILTYEKQIGEWKFAQKRYRGGIFVVGFFEPIKKWHGVTLYPHKKTSVKQNLINALRQKFAESIERRDINAVCEECGNSYPQLHHDNIAFKEIANECMNYFSEDEIKYGVGDDWWEHESEADAIPNNHPAVLKMLELHKGVEYKWLCWECHKKTFKGFKKENESLSKI